MENLIQTSSTKTDVKSSWVCILQKYLTKDKIQITQLHTKLCYKNDDKDLQFYQKVK